MAAPFGQNEYKEIHYFGEPWSLNELERIPHLHSSATSIRATLHANKTLRDIEYQNKLAYEQLVDFCRNNFIAYLKITQQYYLLNKLFEELGLTKKAVYFLDGLQQLYHQYQNQMNQQGQIVAKVLVIDKPSPPDFYTPPSYFSWNEPDPDWSNLKKWHHYESELKRITNNYNQQKTQAYQSVINDNITYVNDVLKKLNKDSPESQEINEILDDFNQEINEILSRNLSDSDGNFIPVAVAKFEKDARAAMNKMDDRLDAVYKANPNNSVLQEVLKQKQDRKSLFYVTLNKLESEFEPERAALSERIKECQNDVKKEVEKGLKEIVVAIEEVDFSEVSTSQEMAIAKLQNNINTYQNQLSKATDSEESQKVLKDISQALKCQADELPEGLKNKIIPIAEQLGRMHIQDKPELEQQETVKHKTEQFDSFSEVNVDSQSSEFQLSSFFKDNKITSQQREVKNQSLLNDSEINITENIKKQQYYKEQLKVNQQGFHDDEKKSTKEDKNPVNDVLKKISGQVACVDTTKFSATDFEEFNELKEIISDISNNPQGSIDEDKVDELYNKLFEFKEVIPKSEELLNDLDMVQDVLKRAEVSNFSP